MTTDSGTTTDEPGTYFFLSYAHVPPTDPPAPDQDFWVAAFYRDLSDAVRRAAGPSPDLEIGFIDRNLPAGSDWRALLIRAMGSTQVFVPLYSPRYLLQGSWPMNERSSFLRRLADIGVTAGAGHIQPVLWIPVLPREAVPEPEWTFGLGEDIREYEENGLRALKMLKRYGTAYGTIVGRLAERIVATATERPISPSAVPALSTVTIAEDLVPPNEKAFLVCVVATTQDHRPRGRGPDAYGSRPTDWRPFLQDSTAPAAALAINIAERLGLPARAVDIDSPEATFDDSPGLLLIDPWMAADDAGRARLAAALALLRPWAAPIVLSDRKDPQFPGRGEDLAAEVLAMLPRTDAQRVREVRSAGDFERFVPLLITQVRRQYLRGAAPIPSANPPRRRRPLHGGRGERKGDQ